MSCDNRESENSPAVIFVGPNGMSTTPANDLPEASEETSAWTKILENFFQAEPLF